MKNGVSRRASLRLLGASAPTLWLARETTAQARPAPLPPAPATPDERYWEALREQFVMPRDLAVLNAANLCPSSLPALDSLEKATRELDREPSPAYRQEMHEAKEVTRGILAEFLRVTPEEIVITRNTSESNNLVSSGLTLGKGDEVLVVSDNHPSNDVAWKEKAKRFGYSVSVLQVASPHPGAEYYLDLVRKAITPRTRVLAFSHVTNTVGDVFPANELCRLAREHGVLTLVDGAQSFGILDVDLRQMDPDFYTGSGHKWPCGPKEAGVLFINRKAMDRLWPCIYSAYPGATGASKTFETFGQRDEPAIRALGEALRFQMRVGRPAVAARARELGERLIAELACVDGVTVWTHRDPERSHSVVSFRVSSLDPNRLVRALYERDRIVAASRTGADRGGLRLSPHFYNSHAEIERAVAAVKRYLAAGV
jgi:selenocysteine lyase/cysteine desulfurase